MARRATSPSNKQTKAQTTASAQLVEPAAAETPRRGRKAKSVMPERAEPPPTDILRGFEKPKGVAAEIGSSPPAKARRGRKQHVPDAGTPAAIEADTSIAAKKASPEIVPRSDDKKQSEGQTDSNALPVAAPRKTRRPRDAQAKGQSKASMDTVAASQPTQSSAARWNADTGTATFDWPEIEQVAATTGPNQAIAKLLLAARAEGANSRWPF